MNINGSGINAYVNYMNYNHRSSESNQTIQAQISKSEEASNEGKADETTDIPPAADVGRIMDFKV